MKLELITNEVILNIINELHPELPTEILEEYQYYPEDSDISQIQSLDSVTLTDLILKSFKETNIPQQVIYLNTDDLLISIIGIQENDLEEQHLNENLSWNHLGYIPTEDPQVYLNIYLYID